MKLEEQVISLELAKKLKELRVKQESYFFYHCAGERCSIDKIRRVIEGTHPEIVLFNKNNNSFSAFTVAELGEMLDTELTDQNENDSFTLQCTNAIDFWVVAFGNDGITITPQFENAKLADALAEILIYLLESNLIEVPS